MYFIGWKIIPINIKRPIRVFKEIPCIIFLGSYLDLYYRIVAQMVLFGLSTE